MPMPSPSPSRRRRGGRDSGTAPGCRRGPAMRLAWPLARFRPAASARARTSRSGSAGTDRSTGSGPKESLDQPLRSAESVVQETIRAEAGMAVAGRRGDGPGQVGPVQAQDQVRGPDQLGGRGGQEDAGRVRVQRVRGREDRAVLEVGEHQRPVPFGQGDAAIPVPLVAACAAEQEQRPARLAEVLQRGPDRFRVRPVRPRRPVPVNVGDGAAARPAAAPAGSRRGRRRPARTAPPG